MAEPKDELKAVIQEALRDVEGRLERKFERRMLRLEEFIDGRLNDFSSQGNLRFNQLDQRFTAFERKIDKRIDDLISAVEAAIGISDKL